MRAGALARSFRSALFVGVTSPPFLEAGLRDPFSVLAQVAERGEADAASPRVCTAVSMATENAVEGCVGETWAALLAAWQAESSEDPELRSTMRALAVEEARNAQHAWCVAAWLDGMLDERDRAKVRAARDQAVLELEREIAAGGAYAEGDALLGLPSAAQARALLRELCLSLWK
jgi:hypothetical protein